MTEKSVSSSVAMQLIDDDLSVSSSVVDAILANLSVGSSEAVYSLDASQSDFGSTTERTDSIENVASGLASVPEEHSLSIVASEDAVYSIASSKAIHEKLSVKSQDSSTKASSVDQRQPSITVREHGDLSTRDEVSIPSEETSRQSEDRGKRGGMFGRRRSNKKRASFRPKLKSMERNGRPPRHEDYSKPEEVPSAEMSISTDKTASTVETASANTDTSSLKAVKVSEGEETTATQESESTTQATSGSGSFLGGLVPSLFASPTITATNVTEEAKSSEVATNDIPTDFTEQGSCTSASKERSNARNIADSSSVATATNHSPEDAEYTKTAQVDSGDVSVYTGKTASTVETGFTDNSTLSVKAVNVGEGEETPQEGKLATDDTSGSDSFLGGLVSSLFAVPTSTSTNKSSEAKSSEVAANIMSVDVASAQGSYTSNANNGSELRKTSDISSVAIATKSSTENLSTASIFPGDVSLRTEKTASTAETASTNTNSSSPMTIKVKEIKEETPECKKSATDTTNGSGSFLGGLVSSLFTVPNNRPTSLSENSKPGEVATNSTSVHVPGFPGSMDEGEIGKTVGGTRVANATKCSPEDASTIETTSDMRRSKEAMRNDDAVSGAVARASETDDSMVDSVDNVLGRYRSETDPPSVEKKDSELRSLIHNASQSEKVVDVDERSGNQNGTSGLLSSDSQKEMTFSEQSVSSGLFPSPFPVDSQRSSHSVTDDSTRKMKPETAKKCDPTMMGDTSDPRQLDGNGAWWGLGTLFGSQSRTTDSASLQQDRTRSNRSGTEATPESEKATSERKEIEGKKGKSERFPDANGQFEESAKSTAESEGGNLLWGLGQDSYFGNWSTEMNDISASEQENGSSAEHTSVVATAQHSDGFALPIRSNSESGALLITDAYVCKDLVKDSSESARKTQQESDEVIALALARYWAEQDGIISTQKLVADKIVRQNDIDSKEMREKGPRAPTRNGKRILGRFSQLVRTRTLRNPNDTLAAACEPSVDGSASVAYTAGLMSAETERIANTAHRVVRQGSKPSFHTDDSDKRGPSQTDGNQSNDREPTNLRPNSEEGEDEPIAALVSGGCRVGFDTRAPEDDILRFREQRGSAMAKKTNLISEEELLLYREQKGSAMAKKKKWIGAKKRPKSLSNPIIPSQVAASTDVKRSMTKQQSTRKTFPLQTKQKMTNAPQQKSWRNLIRRKHAKHGVSVSTPVDETCDRTQGVGDSTAAVINDDDTAANNKGCAMRRSRGRSRSRSRSRSRERSFSLTRRSRTQPAHDGISDSTPNDKTTHQTGGKRDGSAAAVDNGCAIRQNTRRSRSRSRSPRRSLSLTRRSRTRSLPRSPSFTKSRMRSFRRIQSSVRQSLFGGRNRTSVSSLFSPSTDKEENRLGGDAEYETRLNLFSCPPTIETRYRTMASEDTKKRPPRMNGCSRCMYEVCIEDLFQCGEDDARGTYNRYDDDDGNRRSTSKGFHYKYTPREDDNHGTYNRYDDEYGNHRSTSNGRSTSDDDSSRSGHNNYYMYD